MLSNLPLRIYSDLVMLARNDSKSSANQKNIMSLYNPKISKLLLILKRTKNENLSLI